MKMRDKLRLAFENIKNPIRGLVKTYEYPFSSFSKNSTDAHEALGIVDFVMASYGRDDEIILGKWKFK